MLITLVLIALLAQALGLGALLINIHRAPEGYEDDAGFHARARPQVCKYYDAFADRQPKRPLTLADVAARRVATRAAVTIQNSPAPIHAVAT
jgi:hypothetical protein